MKIGQSLWKNIRCAQN